MGKQQHQAASVSWAEMSAAVQSNPHRESSLQTDTFASIPDEAALSWFPRPGWTEDTTVNVTDAVSFALWIRDPLYRVAAPAIRRSMEMEEAATLLHASETAWAQYNGRARGWIRKHLEEDLRTRSGGGDPVVDAWEAIRTTKRAALLLDYVCVFRGLRVALWWPDQKSVTVVPLTSPMKTAIHQVNCLSGRVLLGPSGEIEIPAASWPELTIGSSEIVWTPPASAPSIGALTVAQISERIQALQPTGVRTGGRTVLWNRLMWLTLVSDMA